MQVRRLMEEDNNKRRKAVRREFQDNVRALVAFVRKRDVRVIAWAEQEERKRLEREAAEKRKWVPLRARLPSGDVARPALSCACTAVSRRLWLPVYIGVLFALYRRWGEHSLAMCRREEESAERMRRAAEYQEPEWVQAADAETASSEGAALVEDELYCIACDKFFKSSNALTNHNRCAIFHQGGVSVCRDDADSLGCLLLRLCIHSLYVNAACIDVRVHLQIQETPAEYRGAQGCNGRRRSGGASAVS